jgi:acetyl esterase
LPPSPKAIEYLQISTKAGALDPTKVEIAEARIDDARVTKLFLGKPEQVEKKENHKIREGSTEIPIRVYWPKITEKEDDEELFPIIVFFHGGWWALGNLELYDEMCSMLANRSESIIISVEYRLAPEHKFPAGLHDCYAATKWAFENAKFLNGDQDTIMVAGDSCGGNYAACVPLMAKEKNGPPIAAQILLYPMTDMTDPMSKYSMDKFGPSKEQKDFFGDYYVRHESEYRDPLVSPVLGDLHDLPRAIVVTAEYDTFRDMNFEFAKKLEQSGVKTLLLDYPGMIHGFMQLPSFFPDGRDAIEKVASEIKKIYVENEM